LEHAKIDTSEVHTEFQLTFPDLKMKIAGLKFAMMFEFKVKEKEGEKKGMAKIKVDDMSIMVSSKKKPVIEIGHSNVTVIGEDAVLY
jgi:hypothetical protein